MAPRVRPAARSPAEETRSAARLWPIAAASARTTPARRAPMRRAGRGRRTMVAHSRRGLLSRVDEAVADAGLGDESRPAGVVAQLLAQLADVDAQVLGLGAVLRAPYLLQDHAVGEDPAGPAGQQLEEPELLRGEVDQSPADGDSVTGHVDDHVAHLQHG